MTDVDTDCSERYMSETDVSSMEGGMYCPPVPREKVRAKSARDLVNRQEHLLTMLQKMKSDLAKMDREARHIKEDVVRSNQLFHVMVNMKQPHHLTPSDHGYNMSYSLPKVTYCYYRRPSDTERSSRHLNQLSTFWPSCSSSRRSSVSSQYGRSQRLGAEDRTRGRSTGNDTRPSTSSAAEDHYSGTESDCDESNSRHWPRNSSITSVSQNSSESQTEAAGSSTESMSTFEISSPEVTPRMTDAKRRSSFFYTNASQRAEVQTYSDDVDL